MTPDVRSWRRWSWLLAAWSLATLVAAIVLSGSIGNTCDGLEGLGLNLCTTGVVAGTAIIWTLIGVIWLIGFLLLTLVWFARRPARRLCPPYGHPVDQGDTVCRACGYDFLTGMTPATANVRPTTPADTGHRPGD